MNESIDMLEAPETRPKWEDMLKLCVEETNEGIEDEMSRTTNGWAEAFRTRLATFSMTLDFFKGDKDVPEVELKAVREKFDTFARKVKQLHEAHAEKSQDFSEKLREELLAEFEAIIT